MLNRKQLSSMGIWLVIFACVCQPAWSQIRLMDNGVTQAVHQELQCYHGCE